MPIRLNHCEPIRLSREPLCFCDADAVAPKRGTAILCGNAGAAPIWGAGAAEPAVRLPPRQGAPAEAPHSSLQHNTVGLERLLEQSHARTQFRYLLIKTTGRVRVHRRSLYSTGDGISSNRLGPTRYLVKILLGHIA